MSNEYDEKSPKYSGKSPTKMVVLTSSNRDLAKNQRTDKSRQNSQESLRGTNITNIAMDEASLIEYNQRMLETIKPVLRK